MQGKLAMIVSLLVLKWVKVLERTARYLQSSWVAMHMSCGYDASLRLVSWYRMYGMKIVLGITENVWCQKAVHAKHSILIVKEKLGKFRFPCTCFY